jgi:uncharacterized protein YggE
VSKTVFKEERMKWAIVTILLSISSICLSQERLIAVEGRGSIEAEPDIIRVSYVVGNLQKKDLKEAKRVVDQASSRSVQALLAVGINESTISSSSLEVVVDEDYADDDKPVVFGHYVSRTINFTIEDIGSYGAAIQALVDSEIAEITSVRPDVSDYDKLKRDALAKAAENAREEAEFLASQFGAKLDKVHQIGKQNIRRNFSLEEVIVTAHKKSADVIPTYDFKPGKVTVSSDVYVEYQLK